MEKEKTRLKMKTVYVLKDVVDAFLYEVDTTEEKTPQRKDRDIPFRLRYRLMKNELVLNKYVHDFENLKLWYLAEYGEATEDGKNVEIKDEEKRKEYFAKILELLDKEVTIPLVKCDPEDFDSIKNLNLSNDMTKVLIGFLTNDIELLDDLTKNIKSSINTEGTANGSN